MIALIDGDYLTYSVGFSSDAVAKKEGYDHEPLSYTLHAVNKVIKKIHKATKFDSYRIFLTGEGNFREEVAVTRPYKGNRDPSHKPYWYKEIKEFLITRHKATIVTGIEADDAQAISQCQSKHDTVICGVDKDLLMIPGQHYNWRKELTYVISKEEGLRNFFTQLLTGDTVDNIQGLNRIGKKTAEKLLDGLTPKEMLCTVGLWYAIKEDDPEARLIENGKLLWMMREVDVTFDLYRMVENLNE